MSSTPAGPLEAARIRVTGIVQGVGFRPTVWRLANEEGLVGEVRNDGEGVQILAAGTAEGLARFLRRLEDEAPALARVERIVVEPLEAAPRGPGFAIVASAGGEIRTRVAPDAAICAACSEELQNPDERRYAYAFGNCTNCGPRFSIVTAVPYDRANTTMSAFSICAACRREYEQPSDRRFHAQAIACADCGPRVWLEPLADAGALLEQSDPIATAAAALRAGKIVAIRGLGGFHLACDASDEAAILRLRERKRRDAKPLALMVRDAAIVRRFASMSDAEQAVFEGVEAPIVLLRADGPEPLPAALAPGLDTFGFMRPYTALHLLLVCAVERPLVMTSGNHSDAPQLTGLAEARRELRDVADLAVMHDREIAHRVDDSLVRVAAGRPRLLRRARGYAPAPILLPPGFAGSAPVLAYGAEQNTTFCLLDSGAAVLAQHQGNLDDPRTYADVQRNLERYAQLYDHRPAILACDRHPEYRATKLARERAGQSSLPLIEVQHHHAHLAGCMAEHGLALDSPPVLGVALDGLGYGDDGSFWGGELLLADYRGYRRLASLAAVALPGGAAAMREPWRNLYAHLRAAFGHAQIEPRCAGLELGRRLAARPLATLDRMIAAGLNSPPASSTGRLFDAVAAALGLCFDRLAYQAQAAMQLECLAARVSEDAAPYPFARRAEAELLRLDPAPMWAALLDDLRAGVDAARIAARVHLGLADAVAELALILARGRTDTIVLSGGCMQNAILLARLISRIEAVGLRCLSNLKTPTNDGGVALGQAVVAAARSQTE